jgi:putative YphP/YqiW family bacilliredoxin
MITVFAGNDREATQRAREYFAGFRPSSPAIALMKDGQVVKMLERWQIEGRHAHDVAAELTAAFEQYCQSPVAVQ